MAKKVVVQIKLHVPGAQANPAPPVGPALGQHGLNIMEFCKAFNAATKGKDGLVIPVVITAYEDRSFTFVTKTPPTADLLRKALEVEKGSSSTGRETIGTLSRDKLREVAQLKAQDLNAIDIGAAERIVAGTARSMGIAIEQEMK